AWLVTHVLGLDLFWLGRVVILGFAARASLKAWRFGSRAWRGSGGGSGGPAPRLGGGMWVALHRRGARPTHACGSRRGRAVGASRERDERGRHGEASHGTARAVRVRGLSLLSQGARGTVGPRPRRDGLSLPEGRSPVP